MGPSFRHHQLDALRFSAFLMVFLHHAMPHSSSQYAWGGQVLAAVARAGALGVDLFFTLSAYLITQLLLRELRATSALNIRAFYMRRMLRIWPLYFVALAIAAPSLPGKYLAGFALLGGNWMCASWGFPPSAFALLWSVSIEEQFYLVWPWVVRRSDKAIVVCAWIMLAVASLTRIFLAARGTVHPGVWCNTFARLDPIAGGALLAFYKRERKGRSWFAAVGAAALLGIGGFGARDGWGAVISYPIAAAAAVALLHGATGTSWRNPALEYLGRISYGLYVFHVAWIEAAGPSAALPLTVGTAALSYRFLESPFLKLKDRFSGTAADKILPSEQSPKTRTTSAA